MTITTKPKGTILLIHGFPESCHQFRHVIPLLSLAGYHTIAPDYRGHGFSSSPALALETSFTKSVLATDLHTLIHSHIGVKEPIHVVGHDIGGMIAHAYHFYDRLAQDPSAITLTDLDFYVDQYSAPGAMMCGFLTYRAFELDAKENLRCRSEKGKVKVKAMGLNGEGSFIANTAEEMIGEFYENARVEIVRGSGHWIAEEQPEGFVEKVLEFIEES